MLRPLLLSVLFFVLWAAPGRAQESAVFNVRSYGARGDGKTLDTKAIDKAIAACVKAGGGTVVVPPGTFVTGTVRLFSNVELYLSPGGVLLASDNTNDYLMQQDFGFSGSGAGGRKLGIVFADHAENVSITGTGIIDGRSEAYMYADSVQVSGEEDSKYTRQGMGYMNAPAGKAEAPLMWKGAFADRPGTQIIFHACKRVLVRDITVRNANDWTMDLNACDNVKVLGISIDNNLAVPNSDGVDMYDSRNVIIADCDIRAGDDAIAVVSTSDLKVTNCSLHSRSCGIRIGYNGFNDNNSGNLLFDNIRIYGTNRGIGIFQRRRGNISNMLFSNMIIDTRLYPGQWWGHGEPIHISALPGIGSKEVGTLSNIRFTNIIARGEQGIVLYGSDESTLRDIRFENVQLTIVRGKLTDLYGGNFDLRAVNDPREGIFKHDIPAVFARHVDGLTVRGLDVRWDSTLPDYFTNAVYCESFERVTLEDFRGTAAPQAPDRGAVIELRDGKDAVVRDANGAGVLHTRVENFSGDGPLADGPSADGSSADGAGAGGAAGAADAGGSAAAGAAASGGYGQLPGSPAYMHVAPAGFVTRAGGSFTVSGKPYTFIGANYWQGALLANAAYGKAGRARVVRELDFLAAHGVTNLRILAGAEGSGAIDGSYRVGPSLQPHKGVFSEAAFQGLDFVLSEMGRRNMKAVIYLSNNWDWSGGWLQYLNWNGLLADSVFGRKLGWDEMRDRVSQFYDCSGCVADYDRQVTKLVGRTNTITGRRYSADAAIMAWELANEPRPMRPTAYAGYRRWVSATAALIKRIDPDHLVTTGTEGMASTDDNIGLYSEIHADKNIDYLTIHVWPKNWGFFSDTAIAASMPRILANTTAYIDKHLAVARRLGKPMVIEEFGLPRDLQVFAPGSPASLRGQYYELIFHTVRESIAAGTGLAGCNFWAFGGEGRPIRGQAMWKKGDTWLGDPPMEEQGLNAVFDIDAPLWRIVTRYTTTGLSGEPAPANSDASSTFAASSTRAGSTIGTGSAFASSSTRARSTIGTGSAFAASSTRARSIFRGVTAKRAAVERFGCFELEVGLDSVYTNPYDYSEIALRGVFTAPGGRADTVDGFYRADYRIDTVTGRLLAGGRGHFAVRFSPAVTGKWTYRLFCETKDGRFSGPTGRFACLPGADRGFVRSTGSRYLSFADGGAFIPVGENMGWAQTNAYLDYRRWITKLAANKGNFIRVWMPAWGLGLEWLKGHNGFDGIGVYKQSNAALLDWLLDYCEEKNVYVLLSLDHHGQVSSRVDANWNENPYNAVNGGPCEHTWDFFTDAQARKWIRNRFRYIVARYGYSSRILGWELFNEVDWTDDFAHHSAEVADWHAEMAAWLRRIDVYHHLITTSYGDARRDSLAWRLPGLDFTQTHYYTDKPLDSVLSAGIARYLGAYGKPTLTGEFGLSGDGKKLATVDPGGIYVHNSLWATLMSGAMGPGLPWYWDNYIDGQDLYGCFYGVATFAHSLDFIGHGYAPSGVSVEGGATDAGGPAAYRAYALRAGDSSRLAAWVLKAGSAGGGAVAAGGGSGAVGVGAAAALKGGDAAAAGGVLEARGMRDGKYAIDWWDCRRGVVDAVDTVWVKGGIFRLPCPVIDWDRAMTAQRISGSPSDTSKGSGRIGE